MKTRICFALTLAANIVATSLYADSYTFNILNGYNLIANQLDHGSNTLNEIFTNVPNGSVFFKWNNNSSTWTVSYYSATLGFWSPGSVTLNPGEGGYFQSPSNFTLTFTGTPHVPVLPVPLLNGHAYLLSRQTNAPGTYDNIVGSPPVDSTTVYKYLGGYSVYTFDGFAWSPADPTAAIGQAIWVITPGGTLPLPPTVQFATYAGLVHQSVGAASLTVQSNNLLVSNLGTNGHDGVLIPLNPQTQILEAHWQDFDPAGTAPVGSFLKENYYGTAGPVTNGLLGSWQITKVSTTNLRLSADFSPLGVTNFAVNVYNAGTLQGGVTSLSGGDLLDPDQRLTDCDGWLKNFFPHFPGGFFPPIYVTFASALALPVGVAGPIYTGDSAEVIPLNGPGSGSLTSVSFLVGGFTNLTFTDEHHYVPFYNVLNKSMGNGSLVLQSNNLVVTGIGSSGQDGVAVSLSEGAAFDAHWLSPDAGGVLQPGAWLKQQLIGSGLSVTNGVLGTYQMTKLGAGSNVMHIDFSPIGASSVQAQVFHVDDLNGQANVGNGDDFGPVVDFQTDAHFFLGPFIGYSITMPRYDPLPQPVIPLDPFGPGGPGNFVQFTPNPSIAATASVLGWQASNIPTLTITNETRFQRYYGILQSPMGNASLNLVSNVVTVAGLGPSGQDGLSLPLLHAQTFGAQLQSLDPGNLLQVGSALTEHLWGNAGALEYSMLGTFTVTKTAPGSYAITQDFSPLGVNTVDIDVFSGNTLVTHAPGVNASSLGLISTAAPTGSQATISPAGVFSWQYTWTPGPTLITVNGNPVAGDKLVVTENGGPFPGFLVGAQLQTSGTITNLAVTSENVTQSQPKLSATLNGPTIQLKWDGGGVLRFSTDLKNWSTVPNAQSPYTVAPNLGQGWYQIEFSEHSDISFAVKG